jgi:hypothetical protein
MSSTNFLQLFIVLCYIFVAFLHTTESLPELTSPGKISYPIDLTEPLRILKNITYTIKLNIKGDTCFSGTNYQTVVRIDDDACVTFTDSALSPNAANSTHGQIPGIILNWVRYFSWNRIELCTCRA